MAKATMTVNFDVDGVRLSVRTDDDGDVVLIVEEAGTSFLSREMAHALGLVLIHAAANQEDK